MAQIRMSDGSWTDAKWFVASWTLWVNAVAIILPILDIVLKMNIIHDKELYALILALVNFLLRFKTKEPISLER